MAKTLPCPKCRQTIEILPEDWAVGRVSCLACGKSFKIESSKPTPTDEREQPPPSEPAPVDELPADETAGGEDDTYGLSFESPPLEVTDSTPKRRRRDNANGDRTTTKKSGDRPATKSKKGNSKKSRPESTGLPVSQWLMFGGGGLAVVLVGWLAWSSLGGGGDAVDEQPQANIAAPAEQGGRDALAGALAAAAGNAANQVQGDPQFGLLNRKSTPVLFDKPLPGIVADPPPQEDPNAPGRKQEYHIVAAPPYAGGSKLESSAAGEAESTPPEPARAGLRPQPTASPATPAVPPVEEQTTAWEATPDPAPADAKYTIAADLQFELKSPGENPGNVNDAINMNETEIYPPLSTLGTLLPLVLADQQGPYALVPPVWEKFPYTWKLLPNKNPQKSGRFDGYKLIESARPGISVVDLRTGQPAGEFDWRIPFWLKPVLSPDGQTLVGPYHILPAPGGWLEQTEDEKKDRRALYVWHRDKKGKPARMAMPGAVATTAFVGNTMVAVLVETPQRQLQLWDVGTTASRKGVIELPDTLEYPPNYDTSKDPLDLQAFPPRPRHVMAVSPGGQYVAVMGSKGVMLVSVAEERVLGETQLPGIRGTAEECFGLQFSPSGDELVVAYGGPGMHVAVCGVADGRVRVARDLAPAMNGRFHLNPDARSFVLTDAHPATGHPGQAMLYDIGKPDAEPDYKAPAILRMPEEGPLLVLKIPGRYLPDDPQIYTVASVPREPYVTEVAARTKFTEFGVEKRTLPITADVSGASIVEAEPVAQWTPMTVAESKPLSKATALGRVAWPLAWGDKHALTVLPERGEGNRFYFDKLHARALDLEQEPEATARDPFTVIPWVLGPNKPSHQVYPLLRSTLAAGMTKDGQRFGIADADAPGRLDMWETSGKRLYGFFTSRDAKRPLQWIDFDQDGRLLTITDETLAVWDAATDAVKKTHTFAGKYQMPALLTVDRSILAVSRGDCFDLISTSTGECLNRCGAGVAGTITDIAFSPDGKQVAALYIEEPDVARNMRERRAIEGYGQQHGTGHLVYWNLETGEAKMIDVIPRGFGFVAWLTPEHLCLVSAGTLVFDLKLQKMMLAYGASHFGPANEGLPVATSPDGRIWYAEPMGETTPTEFSCQWKASPLPAVRRPEEEPFFAADRLIFDPKTTPIRLEIDLGDKAQGQQWGEVILTGLQKKGAKIGPGGGLLRVTMQTAQTDYKIEFERAVVMVHEIFYSWVLTDAQGRELVRTSSKGHFQGERSKYRHTPDLETRRRTGGYTHFDFQGKDPRVAILEEALELGDGLKAPFVLPDPLLLGGGKYAKFPGTSTWAPPPKQDGG